MRRVRARRVARIVVMLGVALGALGVLALALEAHERTNDDVKFLESDYCVVVAPASDRCAAAKRELRGGFRTTVLRRTSVLVEAAVTSAVARAVASVEDAVSSRVERFMRFVWSPSVAVPFLVAWGTSYATKRAIAACLRRALVGSRTQHQQQRDEQHDEQDDEPIDTITPKRPRLALMASSTPTLALALPRSLSVDIARAAEARRRVHAAREGSDSDAGLD